MDSPELLLNRVAVVKAAIKELQSDEKELMAELDEAFTEGPAGRAKDRWALGFWANDVDAAVKIELYPQPTNQRIRD